MPYSYRLIFLPPRSKNDVDGKIIWVGMTDRTLLKTLDTWDKGLQIPILTKLLQVYFLIFFYKIFSLYKFQISNAIPKVPYTLPSALCPYPTTPTSWPWNSPVQGNIKFAIPRGLSSQWWQNRPYSAIYAARDRSSGATGSYCCSTYTVADPFSSLGAFSSSSNGDPVFHPIDDCEHPLWICQELA